MADPEWCTDTTELRRREEMQTTQIRYGLSAEYALGVAIQERSDPEFNVPAMAFGPVKQFRDLGYIIARGLVPASLCDAVVEGFRAEVKPYEGGLFRQISMLKVPHKFKNGLMTNGFLNTQDLTIFPAFRARSIEIIASPEAQRIITDVTGFPPTLVESTFWETTTVGTPLHRDGDYITSAMRDTLIAMWVALEDMNPRAGRFCLIPRSHRKEMWNGHLAEYDHEIKIPTMSLREDLKRRFKQGAMLHKAILATDLEVIAPALNKGDAIFWDGKVVHGSLPPEEQGSTRYSIAGHYIPNDDALIKHGRLVEFEAQTVNGMKLRIIPGAVDTSKGTACGDVVGNEM
jgi:phytanoyl-CoA hydroxylase